VAAGERAADFFTLVSSAVRNDLDVWAYLKDVLDRLLAGETDYAVLRPDTWRQAHPEAIREYRATERRDRADRKQYRRAARRRNRAIPAEPIATNRTITRSAADEPYGPDGRSHPEAGGSSRTHHQGVVQRRRPCR
jgi:hypothetical protein